MNINPSRRIPLLYRNASAQDLELIQRHRTMARAPGGH